MFYKQCKLTQNEATQVAWIDEKAAVVGKRVEIKADNTIWDVAEVYDFRLSSQALHEKQSRDRDSLPSIRGA